MSWIIIDEETGETVGRVSSGEKSKNFKILANEVEDLINKKTMLTEKEFYKLLGFMYATDEINRKYNQIKMNGKFIDEDKTFGLMEDSGGLSIAFAKLLINTSWNNMIKKNSTAVCINWGDVHEVCSVSGSKQRARFKKFLTSNNIVKKTRCIRGWRMFVNPKVKRNGSHASQKSVLAFWEETRDVVSGYSKCYFYNNGDITREDL